MTENLYRWPRTRFVSNSLWVQWWHMLSELLEIGWELLTGNLQRATTEAWDLDQSGETFRRIMEGQGVDIGSARHQVLQRCDARRYYHLRGQKKQSIDRLADNDSQ